MVNLHQEVEIVKHVTVEITCKIYIRLGKCTSVSGKHVTVEKSLQMGSGNDGAEVRIRMGGGEDLDVRMGRRRR